MIEGFVLPEVLSGRAEQEVRVARGRALEQARNFVHGHGRRQQDVNVIRHNDVRVYASQFRFLRFSQGRDHATGNGRLPEPKRAGIGAIEYAIQIEETLAGIVGGGDLANMRRKRTLKAPGEKNILAGWMPVTEIPSVVWHHS